MAGPRLGVLGAGVDRDGAVPGGVLGGDRHLQLHRGGFRHREWGLQGQLGDLRHAEPIACRDDQFEERRARDQRCPGDHVVGDPGVAGGGDAAGEHDLRAVGAVDGTGEQRVVGRVEAERAGVGARGGQVPEVLSLEGYVGSGAGIAPGKKVPARSGAPCA